MISVKIYGCRHQAVVTDAVGFGGFFELVSQIPSFPSIKLTSNLSKEKFLRVFLQFKTLFLRHIIIKSFKICLPGFALLPLSPFLKFYFPFVMLAPLGLNGIQSIQVEWKTQVHRRKIQF